MRKLVFLTLAAACAALLPPSAASQTRPDPLRALTTDSAAWQRVLAYVVNALSSDIVRTANDTSRQPWIVRLPADEPQRALLERQLTTILRARPPADMDSVFYTIELGPLRIEHDTARVHMRSDVARRCPGSTRTEGGGGSGDVLVPRSRSGLWGAARMNSGIAGDRVPCRR
jgi:hypothetical protein